MASRALIVNADDFGRSAGINAGVIKAYEQGIVTSAGLMVRWPAAKEAAAYARRNPSMSLGLHLDLGEWIEENGHWQAVYETVAIDDSHAVEHEISLQLDAFRALAGADPTHLDSHQHLHRYDGPVEVTLRRVAGELGIPLRHYSDEVRYCGDFYGQGENSEPLHEAISADNLISLVRLLPPGITEIGCHPAIADESGSSYQRERELEVDALCDPRVRAAIADEGIELRSFAR